ncbi:hypothetical protein ACFFRR_001898, partial [Megaselia abdita]
MNMRFLPNNKKPQKNIIIVDAAVPPDTFESGNEYKLFIWSFMEPPRVSKPTPIISAERYDRVRRLLDKPPEDEALETHIKTHISLDVLPDGTIIKSKSKTEVRSYDPIAQPPKLAEYCTPVCDPVMLEQVPCSYERFMDE